MDRLDLAIKLSKKLGWEDMLVHIALPAIDEIIYISGLQIDELLKLEANHIFSFLAGIDASQEDIASLVSVRAEIEEDMHSGMSHTDAINEWWK